MAHDALPDPTQEARYVNYFSLVHGRDEFLMVFGQVMPGDQEPHFNLRLVTSPPYALALMNLLRKSLSNYTESYGAIPEPEE
ncbi:MAG: DUF3467 domain-containing protein [Bryobacteraceae bacterium]|nr:DUF3467 domain-containing protein [Bryobacteraceae bacterium]